MPLLQGLARLLELLSSWFNVTLGGKLLEHLKKWLEPEKLAQSQKSWKAGEEPKVAAGEWKFQVEKLSLIFIMLLNDQFSFALCSYY